MTDTQLANAWTALEPTLRRRRRIEARVLEWLEARETSLAAEWLGLLRLEPAASLGLCAAAAGALVLFSPLRWLAAAAF